MDNTNALHDYEPKQIRQKLVMTILQLQQDNVIGLWVTMGYVIGPQVRGDQLRPHGTGWGLDAQAPHVHLRGHVIGGE